MDEQFVGVAAVYGVRLTRHAKNRARLLKLRLSEIERVVRYGASAGFDERGNALVRGFADDGREIVAVLAVEDVTVVITLIERRRR